MQRYFKKIHSPKYSIENITIIGILATCAFYYYRDVFDFWFVSDDAAAMVSSLASLKDIFFNRIFSSFFYTPLVALSFKPDVILFGINPYPYHVHNTIVLILISFMTYKTLRLYADRISSFIPSIIVLLSTPSLICLLWITLRQYLYAMLFALLSVYLFLKYKPSLKSTPFIVLVIVFLSELSFMGKEQYMTLPFVLFILCEGTMTQRFSKTYPYFVLLAAHFFLRLYVLEGVGGYIGFRYNPVVYAKTIYESVLTESRILFGYEWFSIIVILPLLLRPRKIFLSVLLWLSSLSISFLVMSYYPQADTYRYWFIATVLFSFLVGFNMNFIRNISLKLLYGLSIIIFFFVHSFVTNKDIKEFVRKESLMAGKVTKIMFDDKYSNSLVLFPDSAWLANSNYIKHMSEAYAKIDNIWAFPPFIPLELLSFYPEIIGDFTDIYEIKEDRIENISESIEERIYLFRHSLSSEKPGINIFKKNSFVELSLGCSDASGIIGLEIKINGGQTSVYKYAAPYMERINLNFMKVKEAEILPIEKLSYHDRTWYFEGRPITHDTSFIILMCINTQNKYTHLSDVIFFDRKF